MIGSLFTAISGLRAQNENMTVIGDNIANVNTPAFKSSRSDFANILNESLTGAVGGNDPGAGVIIQGLTEKFEQGSLESTGNPTDLAVSGPGFFRVTKKNDGTGEIFYTRAGAFHIDANGFLVSPEGLYVHGFTNGGVTDPETVDFTTSPVESISLDIANYNSISIGDDGIITGINDDGDTHALYQVALFDFADLQGLAKKSGNLYQETDASGAAVAGNSGQDGYGIINPGNLEQSNVDLATEFSKMILTQKAFQANAKVITTSDEILTALINAKR